MPVSYRRKSRRKGMTTVEYLQTPETVLPRELAFGTLRVADAPTISHQRVVGELFIGLTRHVREQQAGRGTDRAGGRRARRGRGSHRAAGPALPVARPQPPRGRSGVRRTRHRHRGAFAVSAHRPRRGEGRLVRAIRRAGSAGWRAWRRRKSRYSRWPTAPSSRGRCSPAASASGATSSASWISCRSTCSAGDCQG